MDSTLLQLFTAEEILKRLSEKESTGALHIFTAKESANLFFQKGLIIGAVKGLLEGEAVVKQMLDWKQARFIWQGDVAPAAPLARPVQIKVAEFLATLKTSPKLAIGGKTLEETPPMKAAPTPVDAPKTPLKPARTNPAQAAAAKNAAFVPPKALTQTKQLGPLPVARVSHEEALLKKHPLVLVSSDSEPSEVMLMRLIQLSSLIGRNPACDFTLDHISVSRQHCLLQITDRGLHVKDLGTTNGTKVNGIVLTEGYINVGDELSIGKVSFILEKDDSGVLS